MQNNEVSYLGDGLYVKNDGFQIVLMANDPQYPTDTVYLDSQTLSNFLDYIKYLKDKE